jgi:DNA/RNA endonuclease YhcR with UshA esterase domain
MNKLLITSFFILLLFFSSCGRKQEEVRIYKNSSKDSTENTSVQTDSSSQNGKELNTAAGENIVKITSSEANSHINANAVVKGYVADVVIREKVAYLNFDKKYPKNTFSAVIFEGKFSEVGDLSIYKNQNVEVKGIITEYKGKPQIIISSKNQISIVK